MSIWIKDAGKLLPLDSSIATLYTHTVVLFSRPLLRFFALLYEMVAKEADGQRAQRSSYMRQRATIRLRPRRWLLHFWPWQFTGCEDAQIGWTDSLRRYQ
jgi:hypothetical protein